VKKIVIALFISVLFISCEDPNVDNSNKTPKEYLTSNWWDLEKFTDNSGKTINNAALKSDATYLYGLSYDFKPNGEVWGIDKVSKLPIRGTWALTDDDTNLEIDIPGLHDNFEVIELKNKRMILKARSQGSALDFGPNVNLVFKESSSN
jgi:hypothetical protein